MFFRVPMLESALSQWLVLASDFGFLFAFILAACGIGVILAAVALYFTARYLPLPIQAVAWGSLLALALTPTHRRGANGASTSVAIFDIFIGLTGGDPMYAISAFKRLLVTTPAAIVLVGCGMVLYRRRTTPSPDR